MKKLLSVSLAVILIFSASFTAFATPSYAEKVSTDSLLTTAAIYDFTDNDTCGITATTNKADNTDELIFFSTEEKHAGYLGIDGNSSNLSANLQTLTSNLTSKKLKNFYMTFDFMTASGWNATYIRFRIQNDNNFYAVMITGAANTTEGKNTLAIIKVVNGTATTLASSTFSSNISVNGVYTVSIFANSNYLSANLVKKSGAELTVAPVVATDSTFATAGNIALFVKNANAFFKDINIYEFTGKVVSDSFAEYSEFTEYTFDADAQGISLGNNSNGSVAWDESGVLKIDGATAQDLAFTSSFGGQVYDDFALEFDMTTPNCAWMRGMVRFGGTSINNCYALKFNGPSYNDGTKNQVSVVKIVNGVETQLAVTNMLGILPQLSTTGNYHIAMSVRDKKLQVAFTCSNKNTTIQPFVIDLEEYTNGRIFFSNLKGIMNIDNVKIYELSDEAMINDYSSSKGIIEMYERFNAEKVTFENVSTVATETPTATVANGVLTFANDGQLKSSNLTGDREKWADFYYSMDYSHGRAQWGVWQLNFRYVNANSYYALRFEATTANQLDIKLINRGWDNETQRGYDEILGTYSFTEMTASSEYHIEIEVIDNQFTVWAIKDGETAADAVISVENDAHANGTIHIYTNDAKSVVDNMFLYLDAKDGDLNEDNNIDVRDLVILKKYSVGGRELNNELYADVDDNGIFESAIDLTVLRQILLGVYEK